MSGFQWKETPEDAFLRAYDDWLRRLLAALRLLNQRYVAEIEAWLKENAPWTDQTGNLRQSMYALFQEFERYMEVSFDYGLWYGVFLELKNQGRYAVIAPAFDHFLDAYYRDVEALIAA